MREYVYMGQYPPQYTLRNLQPMKFSMFTMICFSSFLLSNKQDCNSHTVHRYVCMKQSILRDERYLKWQPYLVNQLVRSLLAPSGSSSAAPGPGPTQQLLRFLKRSGKLQRIYALHVDGREERRMGPNQVVRGQGKLMGGQCVVCTRKVGQTDFLHLLAQDHVAMCPVCPRTPVVQELEGGRLSLAWSILSPKLTFFTASSHCADQWQQECKRADLLLVIGSSCPYPVPKHIPQIIIGKLEQSSRSCDVGLDPDLAAIVNSFSAALGPAPGVVVRLAGLSTCRLLNLLNLQGDDRGPHQSFPVRTRMFADCQDGPVAKRTRSQADA